MITMKINSRLRLCGLPEDIIKQVREELTIDNPLYAEAQEKGRLTRGIPKQLRLMKRNRDKNYYSMPRGYYYRMCELIKNHKVQIYNETVVAKLIDVSFKGKLRRDQTRGGMLINENTCGVLKAPTGGGKTVIAIWTIAKRKVPTLIVVHTKELMYQWKEKLHQFLNINSDQVGLVGDGHRNFKDITIGIVNSLAKMEIPDKYGTLIVDECHRVPATTFANVVEKMSTRYLLGLTATDRRSDGLDELIYRYMGGLVHEIKTKNLQESGDILKPEVKIIETDYSYYMTIL
jgi:superfamily II DNA or RNA helicase